MYYNIWIDNPQVPTVSVLFTCSAMSDPLWPHGLQHTRLLSPGLSLLESAQIHVSQVSDAIYLILCHPPSCLQSFPRSGSFPMSWLFAPRGQSIETSASASVLLVNIQDWFPLWLTGLISWQSKGLSRVFSNTTVQKHQFFNTQPSLWSKSDFLKFSKV